MNNKFTDFPYYRMLSGKKVFYKITSERQFIELTWIGEKPIFFTMNATQYPEMLRIMDMLNCESPFQILPEEQELLFD